MTKTRTLFLLLFLLVPCFAFPQALRSNSAAANRSWQGFYTSFRAAIDKRDHEALLRMMPNDFYDGGAGEPASEWLQFIDDNAKNGSWRDLQKSFAQGTLINREFSKKGTLTRVTKDKGYYFEFRKNKRWYFAGVVGD